MCLLAEIVAFICGIVALIRGEIRLGRRTARGTRARLAGLLLMLPIPFAFIAGIVLGVLLVASGKEPNLENMQPAAAIMEAVIFLACFTAAYIMAFAGGDSPQRRRPAYEEDDDYDPLPRRPRGQSEAEPSAPDERFEEGPPRRRLPRHDEDLDPD